MKIRSIAFGMILSLFVAGPGWAVTTNTTINTNTNNGSFQQSFGGGFGSSFSMQRDNLSITQEVSDDSFSQCFSIVTRFWRLVQIMRGNDMQQMFLSPDADDPCF